MNDVDDAILSRLEDTWKSRRNSGFLFRSFIPFFSFLFAHCRKVIPSYLTLTYCLFYKMLCVHLKTIKARCLTF